MRYTKYPLFTDEETGAERRPKAIYSGGGDFQRQDQESPQDNQRERVTPRPPKPHKEIARRVKKTG